jgi:2-oxoglutarate dehydrogenase E1 component
VHLEQEYAKAQAGEAHPLEQAPRGVWSGYRGGRVPDEEPDARIELELASTLLNATTNVPDGFTLHRTLVKAMERRREMAEGQRPLDWAAAEALAFASLAREGVPVRLTGQDSERGTFSQRHSVLHDMETGETYRPLQHISPDQAPIEITNSPLSEAGVLGFEYGYSQDRPNGLVLWEAQFGDFANAAQVVIDQFIASAESKWQRLSGLVLLLPHGYEGMGPEHSSARLERVLNLAVEDNIQVVYPILPAQYFHLLRRQALWKWRKPLIVLTPKSLLRHPQSTSPLSAITEEGWRPVVSHTPDLDGVRRLLLCTGKVYFDLVARMQQVENAKVAIVSIAQLYPKLDKTLRDIVSSYPEGTEIVWVQEEPLNMGAWQFVARVWRSTFPDRELIHRISRKPSASPATGSKKTHEKEQEQILAAAIGD